MHDTSMKGTFPAMIRIPLVILGVPFDNLTLDEATECIFGLIDRSYGDGKPRLVCMADRICIDNALHGDPRKTSPDLLSILRRADMVLAEHMPAVRMSRFVGPALKECIVSGDLISCIAWEALTRRTSIYILGSRAESVKHAWSVLEDRFPGLMVAGGHSLSAHTDGAEPFDAYESDTDTVDRINASSADILFLSLGSPNQEIWFERNRDKLHVPVCICIGDIFASIAGSELCSPAWIRNVGLEDLLSSKRARRQMRKCSLIDLITFWLLILPSILFRKYSKAALHKRFLKTSMGKILYRYWTRGTRELFSLTLPGIIDSETVKRLGFLISKKPDSHLVLDFSRVKSIDSAGLGFLLHLIGIWDTGTYEVLHVGLSRLTKKLLAYNRMRELTPSRQFSDQNELLAYLDEKAGE